MLHAQHGGAERHTLALVHHEHQVVDDLRRVPVTLEQDPHPHDGARLRHPDPRRHLELVLQVVAPRVVVRDAGRAQVAGREAVLLPAVPPDLAVARRPRDDESDLALGHVQVRLDAEVERRHLDTATLQHRQARVVDDLHVRIRHLDLEEARRVELSVRHPQHGLGVGRAAVPEVDLAVAQVLLRELVHRRRVVGGAHEVSIRHRASSVQQLRTVEIDIRVFVFDVVRCDHPPPVGDDVEYLGDDASRRVVVEQVDLDLERPGEL